MNTDIYILYGMAIFFMAWLFMQHQISSLLLRIVCNTINVTLKTGYICIMSIPYDTYYVTYYVTIVYVI